MDYVVSLPPVPSIEVFNKTARFPVHRIYCVGRNYAAHAKEMGKDSNKEPPFFFTKPADAIVANGTDIPYASGTKDLQHEVELVVAIGKAGKNITTADALAYIYGYAVGNDLTRRDLQITAREMGRPWDTAKAFDHSAPITAIYPIADIGHPTQGAIWLKVNGKLKQQGDLTELIWPVPEIISILSSLFYLQPGDLIYTGTPAGVGPVNPGDSMEGFIEGIGTLKNKIITSN